MRRVILLFAAVLLASVGWSQTMTITFDDGSTVKYDMNKVKSIDFTDNSSSNNSNDNNEVEISEANIVGVWECLSNEINSSYEYQTLLNIGDKVTFLSDGTCYYSFREETFKWLLNGKQITIVFADPKEFSIPAVFWISKLTSNYMVLYLNYSSFITTVSFKRIS